MQDQISSRIIKFSESLFESINIGIMVLDRSITVQLWNRFMEINSGIKPAEIVGKNLFDLFPKLPSDWVRRKVKNVFLLKNRSYSSWKERPFLFKFKHNRQITGAGEYMFQDVTFIPLRDNAGEVEAVCVTISDVTDVGIYQNALKDANDVIVYLKELSHTDGLTGVFNRLHLEERLEDEFKRAMRYKKDLAYLMFDLDHFKKVNDDYGHLAGDTVLQEVAAKAKETLRSSDVFGRYGGEEFGVILPETEMDGAFRIAEKLCSVVGAEPVDYDKQKIGVTISIGVAQRHTGMSGYKALIDKADAALYRSKENGRNQVTKG